MNHRLKKILKRCLDDPLYFLNRFSALLRGTICILYYRLLKPNVKIGFPFLVSGKVTITGPGTVTIGKNCAVFENVFKGLSIVTFSKNSVVTIGDGCALGGITIRCYERVELGDKVMTAVSLVQDSYFIDPGKSALPESHRIPPARPIFLGNNVWLGADSLVLGGNAIGRDSVLSAGACFFDENRFNEYCLILGNPARKSLPIDKLLKFMERG